MILKETFQPAFAMVALTFLVWCRLYYVRIGEMHRRRIAPQSLADSAGVAARLQDTRASDNFRNLFELPVLFYLGLGVLALSGPATSMTMALAWAFVALRVLHSAIHCTYNRVMHRFVVYVAGALVLWAFWACMAIGLM